MFYDANLNYPEGIDTIRLLVKNDYINYRRWNWSDHRNTISLKKSIFRGDGQRQGKYFFYICIQSEAFSKGYYSLTLKDQICKIIIDLYYDSRLKIDELIQIDPDYHFFWMQHNINNILILTGLDFFFDFRREDIKLIAQPTSYSSLYSPDHRKRKKSLWTVYDRKKRLESVNQINWGTIQTMLYQMRIEIRLSRNSCQFLNIDNLDVQYAEVMCQYIFFIAFRWRKYGNKLVQVNLTEYHWFFNLIILMAEKTIPNLSKQILELSDKWYAENPTLSEDDMYSMCILALEETP